MSSFPDDYYRRLRLPKDASRQEIKAAFRRLSRQYHPERHSHRSSAIATFKAIREAYGVLIDPVQRQRYDQLQPRSGEPLTEAAAHANYRLSHPKVATDFYLRGVRFGVAQRYRDALKEYDQAIAQAPNLAAAYLRRAETRYALGDDPGVLADCQRAIAQDPSEPQAHYYLGLARFRLGYVQSAVAAFTGAIAQDPEDPQSYARRGLAREDINEMTEAARDLRRAAQLYKAQGDLTKHSRLCQYLRRFGTAGRSRPIRILGWLSKQLLNLWGGLWLGVKASLGIQPRSPDADWLSTDAASRDAVIRQQSIDQLSLRPEDNALQPSDPLENSANKPRRWPPPNRRWRVPPRKEARQTYWAPGVSSRPADNIPRTASNSGLIRILGGFLTVLCLLSNPAGELVPVYRKLSHRQVNRVGYGLAILANLCLLSGLMSLLSQTSWLQASYLWAAGGIAYVSMVLAVAIARLCLKAKGLWAADIFTIGTAVIPLGLCPGIIIGIKAGTDALSPHLPLTLDPLLFYALTLLAIFWALSHSVIALYSGLCQLHPFPPRVAAWFAPMVVITGIIVGVGSWSWLAI